MRIKNYIKKIEDCEKLPEFLDLIFNKELQSVFSSIKNQRKVVEQWIKLYKKDQLLRADLIQEHEPIDTTYKLAKYVFPVANEDNLTLRTHFIKWIEKYKTSK